mgnify:CR=1 FL=1
MAPDDDFILESFTPAYVPLLHSGVLAARAATARQALRACRLCPRGCGVDRAEGNLGFCLTGQAANVTSTFPHHGEEDVLRGRHGSALLA